MARSEMRGVDQFLALKRIGVAGVSRDPRDFSRAVFAELVRRGYDVVPINPALDSIDGRTCFDRVESILPPVEGVLIMTKPAVSLDVVSGCVRAGVKHVWMHKGVGAGAASPEAVTLCRENGINVVEGECPFMFLPEAALFHRVHGAWRRLTGRHPA